MSKKVLTIDRSRWLHGEGPDESYLYRGGDGKMCCLGFDAAACGIYKQHMKNKQSPAQLAEYGIWMPRDYAATRARRDLEQSNQYIYKLMKANDDEFLSDTERETQITALMKEHLGYDDVIFVGSYEAKEAE